MSIRDDFVYANTHMVMMAQKTKDANEALKITQALLNNAHAASVWQDMQHKEKT